MELCRQQVIYYEVVEQGYIDLQENSNLIDEYAITQLAHEKADNEVIQDNSCNSIGLQCFHDSLSNDIRILVFPARYLQALTIS